MKNRLLMAAIVLLVAVNALVLAGVAYNRAGQPDAELQLTERELSPFQSYGPDRDNTGVTLRFDYARTELPWFDAAKLRELGFDVDAFLGREKTRTYRHYKQPLPRRAYVVLEFDGPAWAKLLKDKEDQIAALPDKIAEGKATKDALDFARKDLERMRIADSRLVPVDAGLHTAALRARYPDRHRYLVTTAKVQMRITYQPVKSGAPPVARGSISQLLPDTISLPTRFRTAFQDLMGTRHYNTRTNPPRYRVTLRYGQRHEPWVTDLQAFKPES